MGFLERFINKTEKLINPREHLFEIKQKAQIELIQKAGGDDFAGTWIDANGGRFEELISDPRYNFVERHADEDTHADALAEIDKKLYH